MTQSNKPRNQTDPSLDGGEWSALIWLRIRRGGGLLCMRWWTFGFRKMREISWLAEDLLVSQERLFPGVRWVVPKRRFQNTSRRVVTQNTEEYDASDMISFPNFIQITVNPVLGIYKDAFDRRKCGPLNYQTCMDEKAESVLQESLVVCLPYVPAKTEARATFSRAKFKSGYEKTTTIFGLNIMKV